MPVMKLSSYQTKKNHHILWLDASSSLLNWDPRLRKEYIEGSNAEKLIQVVDAEIARLAAKADAREIDPQTGQPVEIRVSIAQFASRGQYRMLVWDMDPRTLPSVKELYQPHGNTAMCEAVIEGLDDIATVSQKYGDHAFLCYLFTDGEENDSKPGARYGSYGTFGASTPATKSDQQIMQERLAKLPDNVTVAAFVPADPNHRFLRQAIGFGLPEHNIQEWDVQSADGVFEVGRIVAQASDAWADNRAKGIRSTRTLFSTGADAVNAQAIAEAGLEAIPKDGYEVFAVTADSAIRPFVEAQSVVRKRRRTQLTYRIGCAYYELMKAETIQAGKILAIMDKETGEVFTGPEVRAMVGLGNASANVKPNHNPKYKIFVQSTSVNRKLKAGTNLLVVL